MGRLIHYAEKPLASVYSVAQGNSYRPFKPSGLWVSVEGENDWLSWCLGEEFGLGRLAIATEVLVKADANILRITGVGDLDTFSAEYAFNAYPDRPGKYRYGVRWHDVAKKWSGVIIAPYCWERRLTDHTFWYYSWDCASGCIWDASAIEELRPASASPLADGHRPLPETNDAVLVDGLAVLDG